MPPAPAYQRSPWTSTRSASASASAPGQRPAHHAHHRERRASIVTASPWTPATPGEDRHRLLGNPRDRWLQRAERRRPLHVNGRKTRNIQAVDWAGRARSTNSADGRSSQRARARWRLGRAAPTTTAAPSRKTAPGPPVFFVHPSLWRPPTSPARRTEGACTVTAPLHHPRRHERRCADTASRSVRLGFIVRRLPHRSPRSGEREDSSRRCCAAVDGGRESPAAARWSDVECPGSGNGWRVAFRLLKAILRLSLLWRHYFPRACRGRRRRQALSAARSTKHTGGGRRVPLPNPLHHRPPTTAPGQRPRPSPPTSPHVNMDSLIQLVKPIRPSPRTRAGHRASTSGELKLENRRPPRPTRSSTLLNEQQDQAVDASSSRPGTTDMQSHFAAARVIGVHIACCRRVTVTRHTSECKTAPACSTPKPRRRSSKGHATRSALLAIYERACASAQAAQKHE